MDLDTAPIDDLLQELRARERPQLKTLFGSRKKDDLLAAASTEEIVQVVIGRQKVVYGVDDREDVFEVTDQSVRDSADAVVSLWRAADIVDNGDGTSTLQTQQHGTRLDLCDSEPFRTQPAGAFCSGFLVAPDVVATAGHCVDTGSLADARFVFGFRMTNATSAQTTLPNSEIYSGAALLGHALESGGADWALVRLDRAVTNHRVAPVRRTGRVAADAPLYVIGHPSGLPAKHAPNANVRDNEPADFFVANLDTYGGNSGSPVFNATDHAVEGILVRGENDYVMNGSCRVSLVCPTTGCRGEDVTRVTLFSDLVPRPAALPRDGVHTVRQLSTTRFLDAHERADEDFSVVTRTAQTNDTQRWVLEVVGGVYTVQQRVNSRFLDAHETEAADHSVVTRGAQANDTQRWVVLPVPGQLGTYTVQQLSNGRFLDAHEIAARDFRVVTRGAQGNDTQRWWFSVVEGDTFTIRQVSSGRFLDAHETSGADFAAVTRPAQGNTSQQWTMTRVGGVYTIQQMSSGRFVDAHETATQDFRVVTRTAQHNDSQRWVLMPDGDGVVVRQLVNGRFLDAHETASADFDVVTRTAQGNDTQRWTFDRL